MEPRKEGRPGGKFPLFSPCEKSVLSEPAFWASLKAADATLARLVMRCLSVEFNRAPILGLNHERGGGLQEGLPQDESSAD
jgi:hypothetical protein